MEYIRRQDTQKKLVRLKRHLVAYIADFMQIKEIIQLCQTCKRIRKDVRESSRRFKIYYELGALLKESRVFANKKFPEAYRGFFENEKFQNYLNKLTTPEICQIFNKFFSSVDIDLKTGKLEKFEKLVEILSAPNSKYESISVSTLNCRQEMVIMTKLIQQCKSLNKYSLENVDIESPDVLPFSKAIGNSLHIKELSLSLVNDSSATTPCENQVKQFLLNIEKNKIISKFHLTGKNNHRFLNFISSHKSIKHLTIGQFHGIYDFLLKNQTIEVLEFKDNSSSPIHVLYQILQSTTSKIKTLNFNGCVPGVLKNELLLSRVLQFPNLVFSNIEHKNDERLRYLFSLLKDNKHITKLSLVNVKMDNSLFEFLLDNLRFNSHIEELDLSQNEINFHIPIQQKMRHFLNCRKNIKKFNLFCEEDPQFRFQNQIDLQIQGKLQ